MTNRRGVAGGRSSPRLCFTCTFPTIEMSWLLLPPISRTARAGCQNHLSDTAGSWHGHCWP